MWDFLITVGSLGAGVYFLVIEPWLRRRRAAAQPPPLPAPRNPPPEPTTERQRFDALLEQLIELGEPVHEPGTDTPAVPAGTPGTPDTDGGNQEYQRVLDFVRAGYSANQIVGIVGGKRADTLALVRRAKAEIGA